MITWKFEIYYFFTKIFKKNIKSKLLIRNKQNKTNTNSNYVLHYKSNQTIVSKKNESL